ncbi:hypothetical protein N7520_006907 [Penicillium odoratum]|uniref:uncharacterized protein n=1 Tax=Penicillium odoratum TaxID=1167516 RepID=UPI002547FD70|nr:uncharacterized protein N7520_006907 [Penicillium odoratum]KAJ5759751.1 hypothetical protein N7520_006907 [Penicillium odoratum]
MAGSRRSPVLRDQWSADPDRDAHFRDSRRGRGSHRDRGRNRHRDRGRPSRPNPNEHRFDYPARSPPASTHMSHLGPDSSFAPGDSALSRSPPRGSSGPSPGFYENRRPDQNRHPSPGDWNDHPSGTMNGGGPGFRRDDSPSGPPSKRKRTRSPSPRGQRGPFPPRRSSFSKPGDRRDRSPSYKNRGGRFPGRGGPRRRSPRRGRGDRRGKDRRRSDLPRLDRDRSRSPMRGRGYHPSPERRSRPPSGDGYSDRGSRYRSRSLSRHSAGSRRSLHSIPVPVDEGMNSVLPSRSVSGRSPSPRPIPSFDDSQRGTLPIHGMRQSDVPNKQRRRSRPHIDPQHYSASPQFTSTSSCHGSPPPTSPSGGRSGWNGQNSYPAPGPSSPYRQDNYYSQNASSGQSHQMHQSFDGPPNNHSQSYSGSPYRGGHSGFRGNLANQGPDRRYSGSGPHQYNNGPSQHGGRGNFNNFQWTSRGRGGHQSPRPLHSHGPQTPTHPSSINDPQSPRALEHEHNSRPINNRDVQREDYRAPLIESGDGQGDLRIMPPPAHDQEASTPADKGGKFSFAFKAKTTPTTAPKPVPDLAQRMQVLDAPPRAPASEASSPRNRLTNGPLPKFKPEPRVDRRERERGRDRGRDRDRRNPRDSRDFQDTRERQDDRRFDQRRDRRRGDRRPDFRPDRRKDPSPEPPSEPPKRTKILTRYKERPTLPAHYAAVDSVYYRKPGNESVIGAGTYGKVFKGIHVFTKREVALKKIRMEGEKDGFPVTAVREIKLLQHLRSHNVVSLLEVMVEKNECFMVFEYLSHDLTGLINHPDFTLNLAHKKDLAKQMFAGLNFLHHRGVLHRDIKAANILISNTGLLKFADFGLARFFSKSHKMDYTNRVITIWYRPPELLLGETRYGPAVDVWSAACVCMEMFTKKAVFPGDGGEISQLDKIYNCLGTPTLAEWTDFVEMPWFQMMRPQERKKRAFEDMYREMLTPAAMDLISSVFQYDPAKRPTAEQVLQHPYFLAEEPAPQQAIELEFMEGDWHEFESKALRKEARRVEAQAQSQKDREKRKAEGSSDRDPKRTRADMP